MLHKDDDRLGGSPGLVVMGGDSCSKGREFKSQHFILDGHLVVVRIAMFIWKTKINEKEAEDGPFFLKKDGEWLFQLIVFWTKSFTNFTSQPKFHRNLASSSKKCPNGSTSLAAQQFWRVICMICHFLACYEWFHGYCNNLRMISGSHHY